MKEKQCKPEQSHLYTLSTPKLLFLLLTVGGVAMKAFDWLHKSSQSKAISCLFKAQCLPPNSR